MRITRLFLIAMLFALPFTVAAKAQISVGVGVGPAVVDGQYDYAMATTTATTTTPLRSAIGATTLITLMPAHLRVLRT